MQRRDKGVAVVTGASSGIGRAYAAALAARGHMIVAVARRTGLLEELAGELDREYGAGVEVLPADLGSPEGIDRVARRIESGPVSVLVNNAGFSVSGSFTEADLERQVEMVTVHDVATMRLTAAALPGMLGRRRGDVINVSSMAGLLPAPYSVTYNATKAFLVMFTECLGQELAGSGLRVQVLCPGYTHTGFHAALGEDRGVPEFMWMSAAQVVEESLLALEKGRTIVVPGRLNRLNYLLMRALPRPARLRVMSALARLSR